MHHTPTHALSPIPLHNTSGTRTANHKWHASHTPTPTHTLTLTPTHTLTKRAPVLQTTIHSWHASLVGLKAAPQEMRGGAASQIGGQIAPTAHHLRPGSLLCPLAWRQFVGRAWGWGEKPGGAPTPGLRTQHTINRTYHRGS